MTATPVKLSTDPRFDELNLLDCKNCLSGACVKITKGWVKGNGREANLRWECTICHARYWETVDVPQIAPGSVQKLPDGQIGKCPRCQCEHQALFAYKLPNVSDRLCIRCISEVNNQLAELSDPLKSPEVKGKFVCELCTESCKELVQVGELWACGECAKVCENLSEEEKLHFQNLRVH